MVGQVVEFFAVSKAEAACRWDPVVHVMKMVEEIVVSCNCPDVSSQLESVPLDEFVWQGFIGAFDEDLGLSCFGVAIPFAVPHVEDALVQCVFDTLLRNGYGCDLCQRGSIFGEFVCFFITNGTNMRFCPYEHYICFDGIDVL